MLCKDQEVILVGADEHDKRRNVVVKKGIETPCTVEGDHLLVQEEGRVTELQTGNAEEWAKALNANQ